MSTEGLNLQNNIEGLILGRFNGGHSGTVLPGESFTKSQEFHLLHHFCISSLQQQCVKTVCEDDSGSENRGRGVGSPELQVLQDIDLLPHLIFVLSHLGRWEAVVVQGVPPLLNLTLHSSCGLIFGRLDTTRWEPLAIMTNYSALINNSNK